MSAEPSFRFEPISLGLIDEPDLPTRESMDPEKLQELADSIRARGLHQPIGVEQRGIRFAIIYGHRRFVAHLMIGASVIPARVYPEGVDHALAIQADENAFREKVNPAEEAEWLDEILRSKAGDDVERLCAIVGKSFDYVSSRLLLTRGDPAVLRAVKEKQISLGVAEILNDIAADDLRFYYLENAKAHGASIRTAKLWRAQAESIIASRAGQPVADPESAPSATPAYAVHHACVACGGSQDVHEMEYVQVHKYCNKAILEPALRRARERQKES